MPRYATLSPMANIDLNLLTSLDALLAEGTGGGRRAAPGLSASAMSRTLARLRAATGDPLLVRAGRGMVPTPHATELRERVRDLAQDASSRKAASGRCLFGSRRVKTDFHNSLQRGFCRDFRCTACCRSNCGSTECATSFRAQARQGRPSAARGVGRSRDWRAREGRAQRYAYKAYSATILFAQFGRPTLLLGEARSRPSDMLHVVTLSLRAVVTRMGP